MSSQSFYLKDLNKKQLQKRCCPVNGCKAQLEYGKFPYCPEHCLEIHSDTFVYKNGTNLALATKRNLKFNGDYFIKHFVENRGKAESYRICNENSEDAVTFNVFSELLSKTKLAKLVSLITKVEKVDDDIELYLWGKKIDLNNQYLSISGMLQNVRDTLESSNKTNVTEPDIFLISQKHNIFIIIEAKFGSPNSVCKTAQHRSRYIDKYCMKNTIINYKDVFKYKKLEQLPFYPQLFRNLVFAASISAKSGLLKEWYMVNLVRDKNVKSEQESNIKNVLVDGCKSRFKVLTWEQLYNECIATDSDLEELKQYMLTKTYKCVKAFNLG